MKRSMTLFLTLLLMVSIQCAKADSVSMTELRQQVEELGRWTQSYEAHGRTIQVDVPIIVPEVDKMPVATIETLTLCEEEEFEEINRKQGADVTRTDKEFVIEYTIEPNEQNDVEKWRNDKFQITCGELYEKLHYFAGQYNNLNELYTLHPKRYVVSPYTFYYPWEMDVNQAYAEENPLTLGEANDFLKALLQGIGLPQLAFQMNEVCVAGRGRTAKNFNENSLEGTVDYIPMGYYTIRYGQEFYDIPVVMNHGNMYSSQSYIDLGKYPNPGERGSSSPMCTFEYRMMDESCFSFNDTGLGKIKETVEEDVPLAPLSKVIRSIEEKIESGNIRDVYSVQLGYVVMLSPEVTEPQEYYLYPFWEVECSWLDSAKKEKSTHPDPGYAAANFRSKLEYRQLAINAQTGELVYPTFTKRSEITDDLFDCPEIITWEEVQ